MLNHANPRTKNLQARLFSSYVDWLRPYTTALKAMPASLSSEQKLENFLTSLARQSDLAASTQNQAGRRRRIGSVG